MLKLLMLKQARNEINYYYYNQFEKSQFGKIAQLYVTKIEG